MAQLPSLGGTASAINGGSPAGSAGRAGVGGGSSPVRAAVSALQLRKVGEEAAALREELKAAQAEVASLRRWASRGLCACL